MASQAAAINANTAAVGQKILDKMCENEKAQMQNEINQLRLQQAMCGVIRYPTQATYAAGFPFWGNSYNGCCGQF